jgi:phosphate transport system permease protein
MADTSALLRADDPVEAAVDDEDRISLNRLRANDVLELVGCAFGSGCLTWLVYEELTPLSGGFGFFVTWYALFIVASWLVARDRLGPVEARDRLARIVIASVAFGLLIPLGLIVGYTFVRGFHALRPQFFTKDLSRVGPLSSATAGGGSAGIVGSLEMVAIAMLISVPLALMSAVFLNEVGGRLARPLRMIVDAMTAIPSIVAGLFVYSAFLITLHQRQSGFAAALALAVLMMPTVTRTAEVVLRLVPGGLREASHALGAGEWATVRGVVLPTARTGLLTAVILGLARIIGETAAILYLAGGNTSFNANAFRGPQEALTTFVFRLIRFPQTAQIERAWTGALVLLGLVLILFFVARLLGGRGPAHIGRLRRARLRRKGLA